MVLNHDRNVPVWILYNYCAPSLHNGMVGEHCVSAQLGSVFVIGKGSVFECKSICFG